MLSKWKDSYEQYEDLQSRWPCESHDVLRHIVYSADPEYELTQYTLKLPDPTLLAEAFRIQPAFRDMFSNNPFPHHGNFEDVYHAAISIEHRMPKLISKISDNTFRGHRNRQWRAWPTLFRVSDGEKELSAQELALRLRKLAAFSEALEIQYPGKFNEYQRIAIGQHYGLQTWLLDLTADPWVALFFASWQGKKGDVGVLTRFSTGEWDRISAVGKNPLGSMTLIEVHGVQRIEAQKALFLNGSHPDLIDQYVGEEVTFLQHEGLTFESEHKGVTKEKLLSDDEAFATFAREWLRIEPLPLPKRPLGIYPPASATRPLQSSDYREIVRTLCDRHGVPVLISADVERLLNRLCEFHLEIQQPRYYIPNYDRGIHAFIDAALDIIIGFSFQDAIQPRYHIKNSLLRQILEKIGSANSDGAL